MTRGALAEMRTMLLELRPSAVIKTPLSELLAQLTEAVTSRNGLPFQLFVEQIPPLPEEVHISFYRIAQESLNNVVKHAQASLVSVSLNATPTRTVPYEDWSGEVRLMVRDDGCGFLTTKRRSATPGFEYHERTRGGDRRQLIRGKPTRARHNRDVNLAQLRQCK